MVKTYEEEHVDATGRRETVAWRKSSLSVDNGSCVEVGKIAGSTDVMMRDTKAHGQGPMLRFTRAEIQAFIGGVKAGEFDDGM